MDSIAKRWNLIERSVSIPRQEFMEVVYFVLTFFKFNDLWYQQTFSTSMGSPLSPVIANITLQDLESRAIASLPFIRPFYVRYVDDIALAVTSSMFETVLNTFNAFYPSFQFTMEEGSKNQLNFLDITIIINNIIVFDWFNKPTFLAKYLNFDSHHPLCHKKDTIFELTDRIFLLSHPRFHQKKL